jgi:Siphovirus Gp157
MAKGGIMTALYLLTGEYKAAASALADLDLPPEAVADTLESLSGDLEVKAQNVALMARSLDATAASVKQWAKDASERAKAIEARAERLREYLARCLMDAGIQRVEGPGVVISWRKSSAVVIDEPAMIPAEFMRTPEPPPPAPDKTAISAAIKAGAAVPGAHIEHRQLLQIK